jgi:hypothetical protein
MFVLTLFASAGRSVADEITLDSVPPVVAKTVPAAGAADVDPKLTEIKVTFSKDMQDGTWSWSTASKESFPKVDGKPDLRFARQAGARKDLRHLDQQCQVRQFQGSGGAIGVALFAGV